MYDKIKGCKLIGLQPFILELISYKLLFHTVAVAAHELVYTTSCIY